MRVSDIKAATIRKWQNELMRQGYSELTCEAMQTFPWPDLISP
jgi:hypothetical protein